MDKDVSRQEAELMALKATQPILGSQVPMRMVKSDVYQFNVVDYYGEKEITYKMTPGYHMVILSAEVALDAGFTQKKTRITYRDIQQIQDGSGNVKTKIIATAEPSAYPGDETLYARITAVGDEEGEFI